MDPEIKIRLDATEPTLQFRLLAPDGGVPRVTSVTVLEAFLPLAFSAVGPSQSTRWEQAWRGTLRFRCSSDEPPHDELERTRRSRMGASPLSTLLGPPERNRR